MMQRNAAGGNSSIISSTGGGFEKKKGPDVGLLCVADRFTLFFFLVSPLFSFGPCTFIDGAMLRGV
jgi:hypothetical protein